jgi:hypothetical protein
MAAPAIQPQTISRSEAIRLLRNELARRANGEMSICALAARNGIFCKGFRRYSDDELKEKYGWIVRRRPEALRAEIEQIADGWQMARQEVEGVATSCDVQQAEHDTCGGWDDFSNDALARFALELTGSRIQIQD